MTLLADTLSKVASRFGRVGTLLGPESYLRMPAANFATLRQLLGATEVVDASRLMTTLRMVKSAEEIAKANEATRNVRQFVLEKRGLEGSCTKRNPDEKEIEIEKLAVAICAAETTFPPKTAERPDSISPASFVSRCTASARKFAETPQDVKETLAMPIQSFTVHCPLVPQKNPGE